MPIMKDGNIQVFPNWTAERGYRIRPAKRQPKSRALPGLARVYGQPALVGAMQAGCVALYLPV
jgi:hypothetical protein